MTGRPLKILLVVCDGVGVGGATDAAAFGDQGADSLGNCARAVGRLHLPNMAKLGLGCVAELPGVDPAAAFGTAFGRMRERSAAKDSAVGHWEIAGVITERAFPTYPKGFPAELITAFEREIGRGVLGNRPASGTEIIEELGEEHLRTGSPIVYTSADSVFQIAAHEDVADLDTLFGWCCSARRLLSGDDAVGRVIARPFAGRPGSFARTPGRRDFALAPPGPTLLDMCVESDVQVFGVGKIQDIFAGARLTEAEYSASNDEGIDMSIRFLEREGPSLVFTNLVDTDSKYGHRNDAEGYASCLERFDDRIPELLAALDGGIMFITSDHGCDPTTDSTDHTREMVPLLVGGLGDSPAVDLGIRSSFADLGATVAEILGVSGEDLAGRSFARDIEMAR